MCHWITGLPIIYQEFRSIDNPVNPAHMSSSSSQESFTMGLMTIIGPVVDTVDTSVKEVFDSQVGCVCLRWKRRMWCGIFQNTIARALVYNTALFYKKVVITPLIFDD